MGRHAAIGIDLVGRVGNDDAFDRRRRQTFERGEKERHVGAGFFEVSVARHDKEDHAVRLCVRGRGDKQRLR